MQFTLKEKRVNINDFNVDKITQYVGEWTKGRKVVNNFPVSFDIETSSFMQDDDKKAIMYIWMMCFNGLVIYGRTWDEFIKLYHAIVRILGIGEKRRLIIYVHNLGYEFQFIRKRFKWIDSFSNTERNPIYALTQEYVEFRCSLYLSGCSLDNIKLNKYKVDKLVGNLDYSLIRNDKTPLTKEELEYCFNDVLKVCAYIQELIEKNKTILNLPLTKTGFVRTFCRNKCLKSWSFREKIKDLTIEPVEYELLKEAFSGGYTHANIHYSNHIERNVHSYDITSSYPSVMVSERFPMSKGKFVKPPSIETFKRYLDEYACVFEIRFFNIRSTMDEDYIQAYKCWDLLDEQRNNGRITKAKKLGITITDVDFKIIQKVYSYDRFEIGKMIIYEKDYLPKEFIESVLGLYKDKTELKGVKGKEDEYQLSKEMINSCYGMCVTDIVRSNIVYNDNWMTETPNVEDALDKYNNSRNRFLFYVWGVFITAYARRNLWSAIYELDGDYLYSDTDSVKFVNIEKHKDWFTMYDKIITSKIERCLEHYNLDINMARPKTKDGKVKPLGVWDYEGMYDIFKTIGAKRYMTYKNNELSFTISGVNKSTGVPYLLDKYNNDIIKIFIEFDEGLLFPPSATGKMTHTYCDDEISGVVTDYLGNTSNYNEKSYIHLEGASYLLSMDEIYLKLLLDIESEE